MLTIQASTQEKLREAYDHLGDALTAIMTAHDELVMGDWSQPEMAEFVHEIGNVQRFLALKKRKLYEL